MIEVTTPNSVDRYEDPDDRAIVNKHNELGIRNLGKAIAKYETGEWVSYVVRPYKHED